MRTSRRPASGGLHCSWRPRPRRRDALPVPNLKYGGPASRQNICHTCHIGHPGQNETPSMNHADLICDIVAAIKRLGINAARGFDHAHVARLEQALRQAADDLARELRIERCILSDWAEK
jgi:hypothetical protein